ncbi:MAG: hypothetical protein B7X80_10180, partial [Sulfurovum sp. 17-42-90]
MVKTKMMRPAVAMLELIFAIVIMAIILMSAPQLISTAAKSGYVAIQQEAINEAASHVNMIMGYHWDESATDESYVDPILRVASTTAGLVETLPTGRRLGTPKESYRSFIRSDGNNTLSASTLGFDTGETNANRDDMDDFTGTSDLTSIDIALDANYIETTININTAITYSTDNVNYNQSTISYDPFFDSGGATTNIKSIA